MTRRNDSVAVTDIQTKITTVEERHWNCSGQQNQLIWGTNMVFHALTFARSRGRCWKPRPPASVFNIYLGTLRMLMHWENMFDHYYCTEKKKTEKKNATFRIISCTFLFRLFTDVSRTQFPRTMLVLGPGFQPVILLDPDCWYKFTYLMANSADPEANWSGYTLFAKAGHIRVQQD